MQEERELGRYQSSDLELGSEGVKLDSFGTIVQTIIVQAKLAHSNKTLLA
jgi:hypothetical protein